MLTDNYSKYPYAVCIYTFDTVFFHLCPENGLFGVWRSCQLPPDVCVCSKPETDFEDSALPKNKAGAYWTCSGHDFWPSGCQVNPIKWNFLEKYRIKGVLRGFFPKKRMWLNTIVSHFFTVLIQQNPDGWLPRKSWRWGGLWLHVSNIALVMLQRNSFVWKDKKLPKISSKVCTWPTNTNIQARSSKVNSTSISLDYQSFRLTSGWLFSYWWRYWFLFLSMYMYFLASKWITQTYIYALNN